MSGANNCDVYEQYNRPENRAATCQKAMQLKGERNEQLLPAPALTTAASSPLTFAGYICKGHSGPAAIINIILFKDIGSTVISHQDIGHQCLLINFFNGCIILPGFQYCANQLATN